MANDNSNKRRLYDALSKEYDMGTFEQFSNDIQDDAKRKKLYDVISKEYDLPDYNGFTGQLGIGIVEQPETLPTFTMDELQGMGSNTEETTDAFQPFQPSAGEIAKFHAQRKRMENTLQQQHDAFSESYRNMQEYNTHVAGGQTVESGVQYNPKTKEVERTYITPTGEKTADKTMADIESLQYRQSTDMTVGGQLRKAENRLTRLKEKAEARRAEVAKEWEESQSKASGLNKFLTGLKEYHSGMSNVDAIIDADDEYNALRAAIHQTEEQIGTLERQYDRGNGKDVGFWRGFFDVMGNQRTWDFGLGDLRDAVTMVRASGDRSDKTENVKAAEQEMLQSAYGNEQAQAQYGGNDDFWYRAGTMTGHMPAFMIDFAATGGGFGGIKVATKGAANLATKAIGKEVTERIAKDGLITFVKDNGVRGLGQYATNWTIKALGATADDLLIRAPLMTNTVQIGKTASDIIDRKLGDVVVNEDGTYDFSHDKTWGSAIWQGEANAIIENYSEMFGAHLDRVVTFGNMSKLADVVGAKRLGAVLSKADAGALSGIMGQTHQLFNKMGVSSYLGEVGEEYYGQMWRTMLNLDDAYQQNPDGTRTNLFETGQFNGDIWGGMALSMGLMGAGKHTLSGVQYMSLRHKVNKADAHATELLGKEEWEQMRATIDLTTNDDMGSVAMGVINDEELTLDEKAAVLSYMERSMNMRGFNLGTLAQKRGGVQDANKQEASDSYINGYNASTPAEMTDAKNMYELQRQRLEKMLTAEAVEDIDRDPLGALDKLGDDAATNEAVIDYINAKQVRDGMIQRVRDDIDGQIESSIAAIDARTHRTTGEIQPATMKVDDRQVYVVSGDIVQYADGSGVDKEKSSGMLIVRDAVSGKLEPVSPDAIHKIDAPSNPVEEKAKAAEAIREQVAQEAADRIDGVVEFAQGDIYSTADEHGGKHSVQVQQDNGDGTVAVTVDDAQEPVVMAKEQLQAMVDAGNIARIAEYDAERVKAPAPENAMPEYAINDRVTLRDADGNTVNGAIEEVDADGVLLAIDNQATGMWNTKQYKKTDFDSQVVSIERDGKELWKDSQNNREDFISLQNKTENDEVEDNNNSEGYGQREVDGIQRAMPAIATLYDAKSDDTGNGNSSTTQTGRSRRQKESLLGNVVQSSKRNKTWIEDVREISGKQIGFGQENEVYLSKDGKSVIKVNSFEYLPEDSEDFTDFINRVETHNELFPDVPLTVLGYTENSDGKISVVMSQPLVEAQREATDAEIDAFLEDMGFYTDRSGDWTNGNIVIADVKPANVLIDIDGNIRFIDALVYDERKGGKMMRIPPHLSKVDGNRAQSVLERIPKDMQGNPLYEQTDSDTAWDAIVEQTEGDEAMAQTVADGMVADKEAALKKLEKAKSKGGVTIAEKIAAEKERKAAIDAAQEELNIWKKIAGTANRRNVERLNTQKRIAEEAAALRKAEEAERLGARLEAERIEREALNGVPDMVDDTPQDARARGYRRVSGHKIDRQEPVQGLQGKDVAVRFSDDAIAGGRVAVIDATQLQPSHIQGQRNPLHFIDEAQPKERNDEASVLSARKIAGNIRPEEITSSVTAYTGAPTVNARGEAIQGNNRSDALRQMWEGYQDQAAQYKQYLIDHAEEFGLNADEVAAMQQPVLVNMLDVEDADAITLGQFVAQDTESGGTERIKPKNALQKMGNDMRSFANLLLKSNDEETSFAGLVDNNGVEVLKWMSGRGYITPTQYKSAFDSKGNLTAEVKNDLRGIMYQSIFKGGSTRLEEMFNAMPAKAQKAILATAFRYYDSPNAERMIEEIQNSIRAFYALSQSEDFVNAKTFKDARMAAESWKIQYQIDDVTGESYLPAESFSNFALLLATMYKGENQSIIQGTFNKLYDLIQGTQEPNLFEQPDNTPRTLAQAIYETLNIIYDGQRRSNVLVGDSSASQRGQQGSTGNAATGERVEDGERTADSAGSIEAESTAGGEAVHQPQPERKGLEQNSDVGREADSTRVADDTTRSVEGNRDSSDLRVFEEGLDTSYRSYSDDSERTRRAGETERLVNIAKKNGLFIPIEVTKTLTDKVTKRTGESVVYIDTAAGKVTKVKDPYAKSAMKSGVQPEDAAFEHLVHNLLFPETTYSLEGISEEMGDVRIVLSQNFINSAGKPTPEQIAEALAARGLFPEDNYSFGNELVSVTDVEGDNVLLGEDGTVYFIDPIIRFKKPLREILEALGGTEQKASTIGEQIQAAEAEVNTTPTDKQKEAGNYKKGHVQIGTFNVTIEQPKGSVRSGVDADGKKWETTMQNTYGYIRGTEGVDGDHIDVFLSDDIDGWNGHKVFVVDQRNADGSFDEHKVMLGFNDINDAEAAYMSNYEDGWQGLGAITGVAIEDFEKWIASSHRKTKAFAEYKTVKTTEGQSASTDSDKKNNLANFEVGAVVRDYYNNKLYRIKKHSTNGVSTIAELDAEGNEVGTTTMNAHNNSRYSLAEAPVKAETPTISQKSEQVSDQDNAPYTIAPAQYTTKKGKVLDMHLVKFAGELTKEQQRAAKELAKADKGWYDREQCGFMMRSEESAKQLADTILNNDDAVSDAQPVSLADTRKVVEPGQESQPTAETTNPSGNRLVTDERYAELRERMRKKLGGQMNIGIDPEILAIGTEMAVYHLEKGARKFTEYAKAMIADLGDAIRPYLKAFYNGARELPEVVENGLASDMTPYDEVQTFDVANFDKPGIDAFATAETVTREAEVAQEVEVAQERIKKTRSAKKETKKKNVTSQEQTGGLFDDLFAETNKADAELHRQFAMTVKADMLAALDNGTKPYRSILDLRKRARELGMEVDNDGRTDILLQELVEDGLVRAAREVIGRKGRNSRASYDLICKLYEMQPTIAARSSNRIKMQQYSTPLPMAWIANRFAMANKADGNVLEPTAGNGMLVFTVPVEQVHANELDETRLDNLREQGFAEVTQQDATEPFEGGMQYDVVIANPPFGKREAVEYDGKMIPGLDPQITLNALASMKDDGRAAIIIGGNMEYASNGAIKSMKPFFTYLYDHYNVKGVIDMSGGLYAKQGTTFPTRMILIDGRRSDEERAQTAVYPPVESKAIRKAESFDDLYEIINEVLNSKEKTNGTEILHSRERQLASVNNEASGNTDGARHREQPRKNDDVGSRGNRTERNSGRGEQVLPRERRTNNADGETRAETPRNNTGGSRSVSDPAVQRVGTERVSTDGVGLNQTPTERKKRTLTEEKSAYRPHNSAFSLNSVAPAAMVEAMDNVLTQIEAQHGSIDEFIRTELGYDTIEEAHQALAAEQMDSVAMAIYQMKQGQALIIGDQTGVGKGRQMAALIRWAVQRGEKPVFITQKADLFSDIYRDLVDVGSGDLVPFIFNSDGAMVDSKGNTVHKPLSSTEMAKVFASGVLPDEYDFAVLTYSQVNTGDAVSQQEMEEATKKSGARTKKSKNVKNGKATPKATFLRAIAEDNYLFLDESHTAAGSSNTGAYLQSILRTAKAATFASATFAKRPDTMPLYAIRTAMSQAKVEPDKMISIIEKGGVTLQEIMSRELTNAGQMVRRERDMSDVVTDWKTITDPQTVRRARENYDRTIAAFNAIIKFQEDFVKPMIEALDMELAVMAESAGVKRGTDKMGVENVPFASKTYNYTKQLMLALKVDAIADEVEAEINAGRHPVIALESTMESSIKDYAAGEIIDEPTFSASLLKGLDTVMQYTVKDEDGNERHERYSPQALGPAGEKAYYELQDFIRESTSDIFISPLDAIIERLHEKGYKVGELTGRNMYVERNEDGRVVVKRRTDKDKKRMQREFNSGVLDVLILNKSASTGISLHASEKFSDQRQRSMIIAQPLSDINDYMQMIGRIDRTGQVHRGYYINLGLPVPAENRFLMMLSTKLKSLNANTTTSQDSESNDVEAPDLLNKYGSQVVVEYLRDNVEIYEKMGTPLKKGGLGGGRVQASELDEYKPQEDDARKVTGYVALLTTKEQEEFYDDVVRRYNELIKYLNDTGSNDLKINVMPLRAKTIEKRVSSEGIDPNGSNPFARNSFVEKVEMDVLRKPMKADEIRKVIEQINRGIAPAEYLGSVIETIRNEDEARIAAEEERYEKAKAKAVEDIAKQTDKINGQKKRSEEEKRVAIENFIAETNEKVEAKHNDNILRLNQSSDQMMHRLSMFEVGKSYLVPDNLESMIFDFATPAIFCGYKTKDSKITASTTLAVFATLDGRRRIEIKLSQIDALRSIDKMTNDNWDAARATTLDNWDSQIPSETRKTGFIITGNILQAIADTQDEYGGYPGQLISYTDIDGNVHDGILMPDKWNASMLKTSGAPLSSRLQQIKNYEPITSHDGKVEIMGSSWAKMFYLTVPKTKKDGAVYYENKTLLRAAGGNFYPYRGKLRADIPEDRITEVVKELTKLGVKVKEERADDDTMYRSDDTIKNRIEALFNQAISGEFKGKPISIGRLTDAGKAYLEQISGIAFRENVDFILNPSDLIHIYKEHFGNNEKDKGQNVPLDIEDIRSLVDVISNPDKVIFFKEGKGLNRNMFYFFKEAEDGTYNLMEIYSDKKGNLTAKTFYKTKKGSSQRVIDIEKSLLLTSETSLVHPLSDAKVPQMFESTSIEDDFSAREGEGAYTDDEVSFENDPWSKVYGKSIRTRKQRREFAERERQRMVERVEILAKKLHLDNVEVVTDASTLEGKKQRAKGFYSKSTGKITIVIPNHSSTFDVEQTLLHEAVAHYGLRQLFGEHFDTFLDNVFNNAEEDVRRRIVDIRKGLYRKYVQNSIKGVASVFEQAEIIANLPKTEQDFTHTATEEYLASLAENTNFEALGRDGSWWLKIKRLFLDMLEKIGFEDFRGVTLTDNELRYILWRSYENLAEPGRYRSILGEAADVAKQYELGVGNYAIPQKSGVAKVADTDLNTVNERFNEQLEQLTENNADKTVFNLGRPSAILRAAGIEEKPIKLYGNKVIKEMKKHGFELSELKNLPEAVANPIAVFNNYNRDGNRAILTELKTEQGNFLVTVDLGKGHDIDFNIIASVFGKGEYNILNWIVTGKSTYINKEKALDYLHHSAPIAVTLDKERLSSATKIVESFENPTIEEDYLYRDGYSGSAREEYDRRVRSMRKANPEDKKATKRTNRAASLHEAHFDNMRSLRVLQEAVSHESGKPVEDYENAYMHENHLSSKNKVANESYLRNYYKPLCEAVAKLTKGKPKAYKKLVGYIIAKHGLERNAYMAERVAKQNLDSRLTSLENALNKEKGKSDKANEQYNKSLDLFEQNRLKGNISLGEPSAVLRACGIKASDIFITPKTLKEHLEKHNLTATDIQNLPKALESPVMVYEWGTNAKSMIVVTQIPKREQRITVAIKLERGGNKIEVNEIASIHGKESARFINEMINAKEGGMEASLKYVNKENALAWLGLVPPKGTAPQTQQERIAKVIENFKNPDTANKKIQRIEYAKKTVEATYNGVEQNLSPKDAQKWYNAHIKPLETLLLENKITNEQYEKRLDRINTIYRGGELALYRSRDYSGLTALTGMDNVADAEAEAQRMVDDYEQAHDVKELWDKINAATSKNLKTCYEGGLISKNVYEQISSQYKYYIPLKGWEETTAADIYDYAAGNVHTGQALMKAHGRKSVADDPLATILVDSQKSIMEANRNKMKQRFLNLALNHQTNLLTVSRQWYVKRADGLWLPDNPIIPDDADADTVDAIVKQHEAEMHALEAQGKAKSRRGGLRLGVVDKNADTSQHVVKLKRNGETFCVYVNGDPRAARALNGMLDPDAKEQGTVEKIARSLFGIYAQMLTSWSIEFLTGNLARDLMYSEVALLVKEDRRYAGLYTKNAAKLLKNFDIYRMLWKWKHGELDETNEMERYFNEFLENGGETGFTQLATVEKAKHDMERLLRETQGKLSYMPAKKLRGIVDCLEFLNRGTEDVARFATYMTSRQKGRSITRSVNDAKDVTLNFNRKGSGEYGAKQLRFLYLFYNASMQSISNAGRLVKNNPIKASIAMSTFAGAGFLLPMASCLLAAITGGDDDDNSYWDLPEWTRRNNLVFYIPTTGKFLTIPISHELRPFYGMGEIAFSVMCGKETIEDGIWKAIEGFSGLLPFDYTGNGGDAVVNFSPSLAQPVVQAARNTDYFGKPIYKDTPWNKEDPEWTKAYKGTSPTLVDMTCKLSEAGSTTDEYGVVSYPEHWYTGDINPAILEHLLESYTGGLGKSVNGLRKTIAMLWDADSRELRNVPVARKFIQSADERAKERRFSDMYFDLREEYQDSKKYLRELTKLDNEGVMGAADRETRWLDSEAGKRYLLLDDYFREINRLKRRMDKIENDDSTQKLYQEDIDSLRHELVDRAS